MIGLEHYLIVSALLFSLGMMGVILRRNLIVIYMGLELMLNSLRPVPCMCTQESGGTGRPRPKHITLSFPQKQKFPYYLLVKY